MLLEQALQLLQLGFAGNVSPQQQTEDWNGAVWTETSDLNDRKN